MIDFSNLYKKRADLVDCINKNDVKKLKSLLNNNNVQLEENDDSKMFKNSSINLNFVDRDGQTPLHRSCQNGNLNIVKLLVEYGSSQNIKNQEGWYPIHIATYYGHLDIVMFLINEKNFNKDSLIDVFDEDENQKLVKPNSKLNYFNKSCLVYRTEPVNYVPDDYEDQSSSSSSDDSSEDEEDEDNDYNRRGGIKIEMDNNNNNINPLISVNNESFYLNDLNLDELKNLDLNDLNFSFDISSEFAKL